MNDISDFGSTIKKIRTKKGLSLKEVAKKGGLSHSYLSQIESGKRNTPKPDMIKKISKGLSEEYMSLLIKAGYIDEELAMKTMENMVDKIVSSTKELADSANSRAERLANSPNIADVLRHPNPRFEDYDLSEDDRQKIADYIVETVLRDRINEDPKPIVIDIEKAKEETEHLIKEMIRLTGELEKDRGE